MTQRPATPGDGEHPVDDLRSVDEHVAIMLPASTDKKVGVPSACPKLL